MVVYGTKEKGCKPGEYGYKNLKNKGQDNMGFVLIANRQMEGTRSNFANNNQSVFCQKDDENSVSIGYANETPSLLAACSSN